MADRHQFRADWHDYNEGIYFVTICCAQKTHYFGEINHGKMNFTQAGIIAKEQILNLSNHSPDIEIWNHTVMPNHIHIVISIRSTAPVGTLFKASAASAAPESPTPPPAANFGCLRPRRYECPESQDFHHNSRLSIIMRCLKGGVKRDIGRAGIKFAWQSRYHEHIIRNQRAFENIMNYIDSNVENWCYDRFHPSPLPDKPWEMQHAMENDVINVSFSADALKSVPTNHTDYEA